MCSTWREKADCTTWCKALSVLFGAVCCSCSIVILIDQIISIKNLSEFWNVWFVFLSLVVVMVRCECCPSRRPWLFYAMQTSRKSINVSRGPCHINLMSFFTVCLPNFLSFISTPKTLILFHEAIFKPPLVPTNMHYCSKVWGWEDVLMKEVFHLNKGCIYLITNTLRAVILWNIITIYNKCFLF